ncbi:MAG: hypothetical protein ABIK79_03205 [Chloroflexota bacterium]
MRIGKRVDSSSGLRARAFFMPGVWLLVSSLLALLVLLAPGNTLTTRAYFDVSATAVWLRSRGASAQDIAVLSEGNDVWQDFEPDSQWVRNPFICTVTVVDPDGLKPNTSRYRTSTDGGSNWTEWLETNLTASLGAVTSTVYMTVTDLSFPDSGVSNRIQFSIQDRDDPNNDEESDPFPLWVDSTSPESSVSTSGYYGGPTVWPGQVEGTASDETSDVESVDITLWRHDPSGYWNGSGWQTPRIWITASGGSGGWTYTFDPATHGDERTYTVESFAIDKAGNEQSISATSVFTYDISAPSVPYNMAVSPPAIYTNTNCFTVTWGNPGDHSGIAGAYYKFNAAPVSNGDYDGFVDEVDISSLPCLAVPMEGKNDIYVWLVDGAGNADYQNTDHAGDILWYDATPPEATVGEYDRSANSDGWFTATVALTLQCEDPGDGSGCARIDLRPAGELDWQEYSRPIVVSDDSQRSFEFRGVDNATNVQDPPVTETVPIDTHPPTTTHELSPLPAPSDWHKTPVTVTLTVTDLVSGEGISYYRIDDGPEQTGNPFVVSGKEGSYKVAYRSRDNAGNMEDWHVYENLIRIDTVPPTTTADIPGVNGCDGWSKESVTVTFTAVDPEPGAGLAYTEYRMLSAGTWQQGSSFTETREGAWDYAYRSVDYADNVEVVEDTNIITVGIDRTAPGKPRNLQGTPVTWSREPTFTLTWDDPLIPEDVAPIKLAYYKLDVPPTGNYDGVAVATDGNSIQVVVDSEGAHGVSLWLEDCADNIDYRNNRQALRVFQYDATPPETACVLTGTEGEDGWYLSTVNVDLSPEDLLSEVAQTYYRIDGGDWQTGTNFDVSGDGFRLSVEYYSIDLAGNSEPTQTVYVHIDTVPPSAPIGLAAEPSTCARVNNFSVHWTNPDDVTSGIGGAYYKLGGMPLGPRDRDGYVVRDEVESIPDIQADGEGSYDVYVWLKDRAGNADYHNYAETSICYDITPPQTVAEVTEGNAGLGGWYTTPVTVTLTSTDAVAGVSRIWYRVDGGSWHCEVVTGVTGYVVTVGVDGDSTHTVGYYAVDQAGNPETPRYLTVKIDLNPPVASISPPPYSKDTSFDVRWTGRDPTHGGSVALYDVQYKRDLTGGWTDWLIRTSDTSRTFTNGERGHIYYFRASGTDEAGRRGDWSSGDVYTWVDSLQNGDFSDGLLGWSFVPGDPAEAVTNTAQACGTAPEVLLGHPEKGVGWDNVPIGAATISKSIQLPPRNQVPNLAISLRCRTKTYDLLEWSGGAVGDSFDVSLIDHQAEEYLLWRDGNRDPDYNPGPVDKGYDPPKLFDLQCKVVPLDISAFQHPTAVRNVEIKFANWNREDRWYNTWTYVDDVRLIVPRTIYLPLVCDGHTGSGVAGGQMGQWDEVEREPGPPSMELDSPPYRRW